jgi:hypothetical protein
VEQVHALLPRHQQVNEWELLFCNNTHGNSLTTFSRRCAQKGPTILLIQDTSGSIFGGYAPVAWQPAAGSDGKFFGTGQAFLWKLLRRRLQSAAAALDDGGGAVTRGNTEQKRTLEEEDDAADGHGGGQVEEVRVERYGWTRASEGQFMRITEDSLAMGGGRCVQPMFKTNCGSTGSTVTAVPIDSCAKICCVAMVVCTCECVLLTPCLVLSCLVLMPLLLCARGATWRGGRRHTTAERRRGWVVHLDCGSTRRSSKGPLDTAKPSTTHRCAAAAAGTGTCRPAVTVRVRVRGVRLCGFDAGFSSAG